MNITVEDLKILPVSLFGMVPCLKAIVLANVPSGVGLSVRMDNK